MAKANPIKDETILALARATGIKPTERWSADHHCRLLWAVFRKLGYEPKDKAKASAEWQASYNNGRLGYASNCAKGLADAGICAATASAEVTGEFA